MPQDAIESSRQASSPQSLRKVESATTSSSNPQKASSSFHLLAGLASGFTSAILLQPADLLKTRVQQSGSHSLIGSLRAIAAGPQPVRQLWRGTVPSAIRTSFGSALYFSTLNVLRTRVARAEAIVIAESADERATAAQRSSSTLPKLSPLANLGTGAFARASVGFIMMPVTVIKVRYESSYYSYKSLIGAARDIGAKEGLKGFFSGFGATAIRDAPYAGLYVVFYEQGKAALGRFAASMADNTTRSNGGAPLTEPGPTSTRTNRLSDSKAATVNFLSAMGAASTATAITNPPDAIKTRLQLQPHKYKNSLQTLKLMLKEEGMRSLFDGLGLRMARKALSSALAWTVYEDVVRRAEARFPAANGDD